MAKPIYQLYDEWIVFHQMCSICKHQMTGTLVNQEKIIKDADGTTMEQHIREKHPDEITEVWK